MARFSKLCCPKARSNSLSCVDLAELRARGIEALILDLDNTLVAWHSMEIPESVRAWVEQAKGEGMRLAVASNTHRLRRLTHVCRELGIDVVLRAVKPRRGALRRAMAAMGSRPETTAIIGDQLFTDILGGNRLGLYTILLLPISPREFIGTRLNRIVERLMMQRLARRGMLPPMRCAHPEAEG